MRLSEILKSDTTSTAPLTPKPPVKPQTPAPQAPPPAAKTPAVTSQSVAAAIERAVAEARADLEKEFQKQLEKMKAESQRVSENQLREEEQKFFARTESWKKEKQQLAAQIEEMRRENETLKSSAQQLNLTPKEISEARAKMAEEFQKKIAELEIQRQQEKKPAAKPAAEVPPEAAQPPAAVPPQPAAPAIQAILPSASVSEKEIAPVVFDPLRTERARDLYQTLLVWSQNFFEKAKQGAVDCSGAAQVVEQFIEHTELHDDLILVAAEPYSADRSFSYHSVNSAILAIVLGNDMGLSFEEMRDLGMASLLFDIGLLKIRENLDLPRQLSGQIQNDILKHADKSAELLTGHVNEVILTAVRQHHELMNGKGYPQGLEGDDIHLFARIISVVDAFEAMIHTRPYRPKPLEINQAVKEMIETERGLYDRDVMKALLARVGLYPIRSLVELSNKQIARVLRQNRQFPLSPVVQIEYDESGVKLAQPLFIDLSRNQLIHILGPVRSTPAFVKETGPAPMTSPRRNSSMKPRPVNLLKEAMPLLIMAVILVVLVYLIIKI